MENVAFIFKRFFPNYAMIYTTFIRGSKMASLKKNKWRNSFTFHIVTVSALLLGSVIYPQQNVNPRLGY